MTETSVDLPLFAYGTLQDLDILAATLGRTVEAARLRPAKAQGYAAVFYPGRVYPALIAQPDHAAMGHLVDGLSALDMAVLDAFEGEEYARTIIPVILDGQALQAHAYLPAITIPDAAQPWSFELWASQHKAAVIGGETELARDLRSRLTARQQD